MRYEKAKVRERSIEAVNVEVGDVALGKTVTNRKVYRKRSEGFRRVKLTFDDNSTREFRERFRIPVEKPL